MRKSWPGCVPPDEIINCLIRCRLHEGHYATQSYGDIFTFTLFIKYSLATNHVHVYIIFHFQVRCCVDIKNFYPCFISIHQIFVFNELFMDI